MRSSRSSDPCLLYTSDAADEKYSSHDPKPDKDGEEVDEGDEDDQGQAGHRLARALHDRLAGGGEEDVCQLGGQALETTLDNKGVKAEEDNLEEDHRVVAEYCQDHLVLHEKPDGEKADAGEEEADEEHEPPANGSEKPGNQETGDQVDPTHKHPPVV